MCQHLENPLMKIIANTPKARIYMNTRTRSRYTVRTLGIGLGSF
jgi:hypothetical protein